MTNLLTILLQATTTVVDIAGEQPVPVPDESYFSLILKGGWILLPIFLLSLLAIYVIISKWLQLNRVTKRDTVWLSRVTELVSEGKIEKALKFCMEKPYAQAKVISTGLKEANKSMSEIEEAMEIEARQQLNILENQMNWLEITASIAPMLGFLGTIFGMIKIFYDIAKTNDLAFDTISTGLYQKMICSGAGLLVGIVAYAGYNILNGRIDKAVVNIEKDSNEVVKALRIYKNQQTEPQKQEV